MESLYKNIINNTAPPMKALDEDNGNHIFMVCTSYLIIGLLIGMLSTSLIANSLKLKKHIAEQKGASTNGQ